MLNQLIDKYREIEFMTTKDKKFLEFGRLLRFNKENQKLIDEGHRYITERTEIPESGNIYVGSDSELEKLPFVALLKEVFGFVKIQCGYCNGNNQALGALEYHKSSEITFATTNCVLLLGKPNDLITEYDDEGQLIHASFDSSKCVALYLEAGEVIELKPEILHFSPIKIGDEGFKTMIVLPKGTNVPLKKGTNDRLLFMVNKWLIVHKDRQDLIDKGAYRGLIGNNIKIEN